MFGIRQPIRSAPTTSAAKDPWRTVDYSGALSQAADQRALLTIVGARLHELSDGQAVMFCVCRPGDSSYASTHAFGPVAPPDPPVVFEARGRLARWLRTNAEPLVLADRPDVVRYLGQDERTRLMTLGVAMCLPLMAGHRLLAMVLIIAPTLSRPSLDMVSMLQASCGQAAVAMEGLALRLADRDRLHAASRTQQLAVAGQLAASVAHEVRNPLATISSSVQYAIESSTDWPRKIDVLRDAMGEIDRINRTVSGMLSLSRPQAPELTDLDLGTVLEDALQSLQPYVDHHQLSLTQPSDGPALPVRGDAGQLRQVLLNVLLNACQATPSGGRIRVLKKVDASAAAGSGSSRGQAVVVITDSGPGIPSDQLARVFEPFFTTKPTGTGLGLSICAEIMKAHAGRIEVERSGEPGATIVLALPLRED